MLRLPGKETIDSDAQLVLNKLNENGGELPFNDKSDPTEINNFFGLSKKAFKRAIGTLYKSRTIEITQKGIKKV